jgi:hypothetical protein
LTKKSKNQLETLSRVVGANVPYLQYISKNAVDYLEMEIDTRATSCGRLVNKKIKILASRQQSYLNKIAVNDSKLFFTKKEKYGSH